MEKEMSKKPMRKAELNAQGAEILDPVPMAPPIGYERQPTLAERIRDMVRSEHMRLAAMESGAETFDEADDFDVDEDFDPSTPYEETFDPVEYRARKELREEEFRAEYLRRKEELAPKKEDTNGEAGRDDQSGVLRSGGPAKDYVVDRRDDPFPEVEPGKESKPAVSKSV